MVDDKQARETSKTEGSELSQRLRQQRPLFEGWAQEAGINKHYFN